jgi:hypothetical protein
MAKQHQAKKVVRKSDVDQALTRAMHGEHNTIIPLNQGLNAYVLHPLNSKTIHCSTRSTKFVDVIAELTELGLGERINTELTALGVAQPEWIRVQTWLKEQLEARKTVAVEAVA